MLKVFCAPSRYTQGPHATEQLGAETRTLGLDGPAFLVAGRSAIRLLSETWSKTFAAVEMRHAIFAFGGECTAARETNARVVIGAGGGKVLDTARHRLGSLSQLPNHCFERCPVLFQSSTPKRRRGKNTAFTVAIRTLSWWTQR
jgi:glycerol dehydrogenase